MLGGCLVNRRVRFAEFLYFFLTFPASMPVLLTVRVIMTLLLIVDITVNCQFSVFMTQAYAEENVFMLLILILVLL